uniref:RNase H type-1 domain-containing protein n=1 Tax=Chenopodium quinoa TaxID=63459 RepID=A0A803KWA8_CHEQI
MVDTQSNWALFRGKRSPTPFNRGSHIWSAVGKGWDLFRNSLIWEVGNGENISHWKDRWLHSDSMRSLLVGPLPPNSDEINLANITIHNRGELEQAINFQIPDDIFTRIESINLSTSEDFNFTTWTKRAFLRSTKESGCAGVCRNEHGTWIEGFQWKGFSTSASDAELQAILLALTWIKDRGWTSCHIESDSKFTVQDIQHCRDYLLTPKVNACRLLLQEQADVKLYYGERGKNSVADLLAKDARRNLDILNSFCIITDPPDACKRILEQDAANRINGSGHHSVMLGNPMGSQQNLNLT